MNDEPVRVSPWRQALREARGILFLSVAVAVIYNLFSATSIPWISEARAARDTNQTTISVDVNIPDTTPPVVIDTPRVAPVDTPGTAVVIDSVPMAALTARQRDSLLRWRQDSIARTQKVVQPNRDSIARAQRESFLAQVAQAKEINTETAKRLFDMKGAIFIDARPEQQYSEGHIPGALHAYGEQWQAALPTLSGLDRNAQIVAYCGGGDCELSHDLARGLAQIGFKKVVVYTGGTTEWMAKNYPFGK